MFYASTILQQGAPAGGGGSTLIFLALFVVLLYFMIIRPQQKRAKEHRTMLENLRRGDTVVTSSGLIGKIARLDDTEVQVDLADGVRVKMLKQAISDVRSKTEPVKGGEGKSKQAAKGGKQASKSGKQAERKDQEEPAQAQAESDEGQADGGAETPAKDDQDETKN